MAILFVGSEDIGFTISGAYDVSADGSTFPQSLRQSLVLRDPATTLTAGLSAASGAFWVSAYLYKSGAVSAAPLVQLIDGSTVRLSLNLNTSGQFELRTGSLLATSTDVFDASRLLRFDMQVDFINGAVRLYRGPRLVLTYTGNLGGGTVDRLALTNPGPSTSALYVSAVIAQTTCTRRTSLYALVPNALVEATNWSGAITALNEQKLDDTTYMSTNTSNAVVSAALSSGLVGNLPIRAVVESARLSGADSAQIGLSSGGVYAMNPAVTGSDSSVPQNYTYAVTQNPFTNSNWSVADIASIRFSIQLSDNGMTYLVDQNGNTVTDENGNAISF